MVLPFVLIFLAVAAAGGVAYGALPYWGQFAHGFELILLTRRLQWPLVLVCLVACLALIGLVIGGKRRVWWLIGLLPVLALFYRWDHRSAHSLAILDNPAFVSAEQSSSFLRDEDWVVGALLGDTWYAYPYAALFTAPVVVQPEQGRRMMLLWSPYANHATAAMIERDLKPRELEVMGMPGNALVVYNARYGQFINGLTGLTNTGEKPLGFGMQVSTSKMTWGQWRGLHPQSKVLGPTGRERQEARGPVAPAYRLPGMAAEPGSKRVAVLATTRPVAVVTEKITKQPENLTAGQAAVLMFRDPVTGQLKAFSREIGEQLTPRFKLAKNPRKATVFMVDGDTGCGWDRNGVVVEGDKSWRGQKLTAIGIEEDLDWAVTKYWRPEVEMAGGDHKVTR